VYTPLRHVGSGGTAPGILNLGHYMEVTGQFHDPVGLSQGKVPPQIPIQQEDGWDQQPVSTLCFIRIMSPLPGIESWLASRPAQSLATIAAPTMAGYESDLMYSNVQLHVTIRSFALSYYC
jgi:hypothetical protein